MSLSLAARSSARGSAREEDARQGLRCAPLPVSISFQKKPSAVSRVSCCPPYQQSHSKDFPGMSFSLPCLFPHLPLYSQVLYKISGTGEIKNEKRKKKKRPLTASLHSPPPPPSSLFLSLRPGGPETHNAQALSLLGTHGPRPSAQAQPEGARTHRPTRASARERPVLKEPRGSQRAGAIEKLTCPLQLILEIRHPSI